MRRRAWIRWGGLLLSLVLAGGLSAQERFVAPAQGVQISGAVVDAATGDAIAEAQITVGAPFNLSATTDADGTFAFAPLTLTGDVAFADITFSAEGYGTLVFEQTTLRADLEKRFPRVALGPDERALPSYRDSNSRADFAAEFAARPIVPEATGLTLPDSITVAITGFRDGNQWREAGFPILSVDEINYYDYVRGVLPEEWPSAWEAESLKAGAMAVKMFGWWRMVVGGSVFGDFDVTDNTYDQVYTPYTTPTTAAAVDATWPYIFSHNDRIVEIHYVSTDQLCEDLGWSRCMGQWGSQFRAQDGETWQQIIQHYYAPITIALTNPDAADQNVYLFTSPQNDSDPSELAGYDLAGIPALNGIIDSDGFDLDGDGVDEIGTLKRVNGETSFVAYSQPTCDVTALEVARDESVIPRADALFLVGGQFDNDAPDEVGVLRFDPIEGNGDQDFVVYDVRAGDQDGVIIGWDLWGIPSGNQVRDIAAVDWDGDGIDELAVLKDDGGDLNLYIYETPQTYTGTGVPGVLLASDLWSVDGAVMITGGDLVVSNPGDEIGVLKLEGGDPNLYIYALPQSIEDSAPRLARDLVTIPAGETASLAAVRNPSFPSELIGATKLAATDHATLPCGTSVSADVDGDGLVGPADLIYFVNRVGSSDLSADYDGDGDVDSADVEAVRAQLGSPPSR